MFPSVIYSLLDKLSGEAFERWDNHQAFINTRLAIRDRLRREARLNAELLGKMKGIESLIEELSINTLQEVFEMPIPLNKIMNKHLSDRVKGILNNNKKYQNWTKNVHSEADLVERLWHRTRMLQINKKYKQVKPNLAYLCVLNRALVESLSKEI